MSQKPSDSHAHQLVPVRGRSGAEHLALHLPSHSPANPSPSASRLNLSCTRPSIEERPRASQALMNGSSTGCCCSGDSPVSMTPARA